MVRIIFVAGIHGVGKTTYCQKRSNIDKIPHYSASELIKKHVFLNGKNTEKIERNQNILYSAIAELKEEVIYLDGHFCLFNKEGKPEKIPKNIFEKLNIISIVLLYGDLKEILMRINKRDCSDYSIEKLEQLQKNEIEYAEELAKELEIPLKKIQI
ncbi:MULTISPECIES: ATP-binding protein [Fusobacterium]|jgi:adenylate kinase|uniref:ATP-binding protein n=1 Tax=Fusobacterium TaxID=848 RepID=UPI000E8393E8|nr:MULTISPECIES: ATP-binding protein [Fusobacterium]DAE77823.1 MAG TPA: AAA domain protein [Caudoviricetes sp.]HBJ79747.1 hypothetical protein [Fusobacterium sp.]